MIDATRDADLRRSPRNAYVHFAWFHRIDSGGNGTLQGIAHSCDIADGGIGFVTTHTLPVGARLFLILVAPVGRVAAIGSVKNCVEDRDGFVRVGVEIEIIPPTDQSTWNNLARSQK
jgi:hypothetical protein